MITAARISATFLAVSTAVFAFPSIRNKVPNGERVPCPPGEGGCQDGHCWGLGHATCHGGSFPLNPFGLDLQKAGHKWTKALCEKDSDGDGFTNGEELGDPCCVWGAFDVPSDYMAGFTASHPGVTNEKQVNYVKPACGVTTPKVQAPVMGLFNPGEEHRVAEVYINNYTLPMPGNQGKRTQYTTFAWNFPDDSAEIFHVISAEAIVKTPKNLHHYIVNGCDKKFPADQHGKAQSGRMECNSYFGGWAPGKPIVEMPSWGGLAIGKAAGIVAFSVNVHFDNPDLESGIVMNDGMRIHYTTTLRKATPTIFATMQISVNPAMMIPPRQKRYFITRKCTVTVKDRKKYTNGTVPLKDDGTGRLLLASHHAHLLGTEAYAERIRDGVRTPIVSDNIWYFDDQYSNVVYPRNITLKTGDELLSTCIFNSQSRAVATIVGQETIDEMCWSQYTFAEGNLKVKCAGDVWTGSLNDTENALGLDRRHPVTEADSVFDGEMTLTGGSLKKRSGQMTDWMNEMLAAKECVDNTMLASYCGMMSGMASGVQDCDKTFAELGVTGQMARYIGSYTPLQTCCESLCKGVCSSHKVCVAHKTSTTTKPQGASPIGKPEASGGASLGLWAFPAVLILKALRGS